MNVRWLKWRDVLAEAALLRNVDNALNQVEAPEARRIAQAVNVAVDYAWKFHPWECACWVVPDVCMYGLQLANIVERGYAVLRVYKENPITEWEAEREAKVISFRETRGALQFGEVMGDLTEAYYLVRLAPPQFGTASRNAATTYEQGDCIYDPATGEAWRCHRSHTSQAVPTWLEWTQGASYTAAMTEWVRWQGVLWDCAQNHTSNAGSESTINAPANSVTYWQSTPHYWSPQRLPHFLLPAVLAGARVWLEGGGTGAMQEAMLPALETEVSDYTITRAQRLAPGRSSTIL